MDGLRSTTTVHHSLVPKSPRRRSLRVAFLESLPDPPTLLSCCGLLSCILIKLHPAGRAESNERMR